MSSSKDLKNQLGNAIPSKLKIYSYYTVVWLYASAVVVVSFWFQRVPSDCLVVCWGHQNTGRGESSGPGSDSTGSDSTGSECRGVSAALSPAGVTENTGVELTGQEDRTDTEPALCLHCQTRHTSDNWFPSNTFLHIGDRVASVFNSRNFQSFQILICN